jgi:hydrogenase maturation protein HypF
VEQRVLQSVQSPIVLVDKRRRVSVCDEVTGSIATLGVMLPYTPLHHLLITDLGFPIVATSGNLSDEPICIDERQAVRRLTGIADAFLVHNRSIARHVDDSVVRVIEERPIVLRRARGYAPLAVATSEIPEHSPKILAVGGHTKNSLALAGEDAITLSQHIGDLDSVEAHRAFVRAGDDLARLLDMQPDRIACDLHPDYHSTIWAKQQRLPTLGIQHHHAHIAACMMDNDLEGEVLGVAWDGAGDGGDGTVWGGEFLYCSKTRYRRIAHLRTFLLPGGDAAAREPRRSALGLLFEVVGDELFDMKRFPPVAVFANTERAILHRMLRHGGYSARTSSAGRLFDAVASILNLNQISGFEGQAAMLLESAAAHAETSAQYDWAIQTSENGVWIVDWEPMVRAMLADLDQSTTHSGIAAKVHNTLAAVLTDIALRHAEATGEKRVVLSGGCFQNRVLLEQSITLLHQAGLAPYWHQRIPPNDGGISAGQAAIALARWKEERECEYVSGCSREN